MIVNNYSFLLEVKRWCVCVCVCVYHDTSGEIQNGMLEKTKGEPRD